MDSEIKNVCAVQNLLLKDIYLPALSRRIDLTALISLLDARVGREAERAEQTTTADPESEVTSAVPMKWQLQCLETVLKTLSECRLSNCYYLKPCL